MYKQILVAVDGSSTSDVALREEALELTTNTRARLRIVHVIDSPYDYPDTIYGFVPGDLEELREAWRKMGQAILDQALAAARQAGVTPESAMLEMAGRRVSTPKDIHVTLQENFLTIKGEKKQEKEEKDERHHRVERSYGAFTRSVRLPAAVDGSKVDAKFKNGLLTVTMPKTPGAKGTTIPVKAE